MAEYNWPYPDEFGQTETVDSDILVLGGGLAGCFAAIAAARRELNSRRGALAVVLLQCGVAWFASFVVYHILGLFL